jgi:hypothetical protein
MGGGAGGMGGTGGGAGGTGGTGGGMGGMGGTGGGAGGMGGMGGGPPPPCGTLSYSASIADCVNPAAPDPDDCAADAAAFEGGPGRMVLDTYYSNGGGGARTIYLRFDLDAAFAAADVATVALELSTPPDAWAASDNTGDIWSVGSFTRPDLFSAASLPADLGATAISGSLGVLAAGATVSFPLPTALAIPGAAVTLRVRPLSTDGAVLWNMTGTTPPRLVITCTP